MELTRRPFQGVLNILDFNRHFYIFGVAFLALLIGVGMLITLPSIIIYLVIIGFAYGLFMPLIVSAYVYDFSGYYSFDWLDEVVADKSQVEKVVNIHAGFDETSYLLNSKLPRAELSVFDFYDAEHHTEAAIIRARRVSQHYPGTQEIETFDIPMEDNSVDVVCCLSTAHEIRNHSEKVAFLKECARISKTKGKLIVVEHLRDLPNFLAFTIGFTHFFSRSTWKRAFTEAGYTDIHEKKFTPFMSIFECTL